MTTWTLPTREQIHFSPPDGFELLWMTPAKFLELAPPLGIPDPESDQYIQHFVQKLRDGDPLDPPELAFNHHDGRHRATAAQLAEVYEMPVYVSEPFHSFLLEKGFAQAQKRHPKFYSLD